MTTREQEDQRGMAARLNLQTMFLRSSSGRGWMRVILDDALAVLGSDAVPEKGVVRAKNMQLLIRAWGGPHLPDGEKILRFHREHAPKGHEKGHRSYQLWSLPGALARGEWDTHFRDSFNLTQTAFRFLAPFVLAAWGEEVPVAKLQAALALHPSQWSNVGNSLISPEVMGPYLLGAKTTTHGESLSVQSLHPPDELRQNLRDIYGHLLPAMTPPFREVTDIFDVLNKKKEGPLDR